MAWFSVRCVFHHFDMGAYEERITLWEADGFEQAIGLAETEATHYVEALGSVRLTGLSQAYHLADEPKSGAEVFSLLRRSPLPGDEYLDTFFTTGTEIQSGDEE